MKKSIKYYESQKAKTSICHRTTFYSIFNMSLCRKPEIQNDLPKNSGKTMFILSCFNNYSIEFSK